MYSTHWEDSGIYWQFYGVVPISEIDEVNDLFYKDNRSDKCKYQLVDLINVERLDLESKEIEHVAAIDAGASFSIKYLKVAIVVKSDSILSLCEEYVCISREINSTWAFEIFGTLKEAREWLDD